MLKNNADKLYSEITLDDALEKIHTWAPVLIYYNDEVIWDDIYTTFGVDWIPYHDAIAKFKEQDLDWHKIRITDIKIEVVHFHHSIIRFIGGKV